MSYNDQLINLKLTLVWKKLFLLSVFLILLVLDTLTKFNITSLQQNLNKFTKTYSKS